MKTAQITKFFLITCLILGILGLYFGFNLFYENLSVGRRPIGGISGPITLQLAIFMIILSCKNLRKLNRKSLNNLIIIFSLVLTLLMLNLTETLALPPLGEFHGYELLGWFLSFALAPFFLGIYWLVSTLCNNPFDQIKDH